MPIRPFLCFKIVKKLLNHLGEELWNDLPFFAFANEEPRRFHQRCRLSRVRENFSSVGKLSHRLAQRDAQRPKDRHAKIQKRGFLGAHRADVGRSVNQLLDDLLCAPPGRF